MRVEKEEEEHPNMADAERGVMLFLMNIAFVLHFKCCQDKRKLI